MLRSVAQKRIALVWYIGFGLITSFFFLQILTRRFGLQASDAVNWFLPTALPTVLLITGALSQSNIDHEAESSPFLYRSALMCSILYVIAVFLALVAATLQERLADTLGTLADANLVLGPLQGLAAAFLAAFFVQPPSKPRSNDE